MDTNNAVKKPGRNPLGRGLSALISSPVIHKRETPTLAVAPQAVSRQEEAASPTAVPDSKYFLAAIDDISPCKSQPRQQFKERELIELAESIRAVGIIQPIVLRRLAYDASPHFQIIAGERRWRAAKLAGLTEVPVVLENHSEKATLEVALIENIQRENLNPIEEAQAYKKLMDEHSLTQKELSERVGKDRATVANFLRLLALPEPIVAMVRDGHLSFGHAKAIMTVKEPSAQISLARKVQSENLSVRALEAIVSRVVVLDAGKRAPIDGASKRRRGGSALPEVEERLRRGLGTKVSLRHSKSGRGRIEIEYFSNQELDRLVELICR